MFDANKDGVMEPSDFKALLKHADVIVRDQDLLKVFELIDLQQTGKISYTDFLNVVEKNIQLPIEQIVKKRRRERGESYIEGEQMLDPLLYPEEAARLRAFKTY
jgi:Ca2+-binding EF-hand superfamily protein